MLCLILIGYGQFTHHRIPLCHLLHQSRRVKSDQYGSVKPLKLKEIAVISLHVVNVCECECQCELVSVIVWKERD